MSFQYVTIYHGPCDSFYTVTHKPQKLRGLKDKLQKLGYRVDLVPVLYVNYCMLEICGHEVSLWLWLFFLALCPVPRVWGRYALTMILNAVFRCNIQNLLFNTPHDLDPVCQRAVESVQQATTMLQRARHYMWFWTLIEKQLFLRSPYGPRDYWPTPMTELAPFATCLDCVNCCGILAQKKK